MGVVASLAKPAGEPQPHGSAHGGFEMVVEQESSILLSLNNPFLSRFYFT